MSHLVLNLKLQEFEFFLSDLRSFLITQNPLLIDLYDTFSAEAKFARLTIDDNLRAIPAGQHILEIGGGLMLLSIQLQREGYRVTSLEPIGSGFSIFDELQTLILNYAKSLNCMPSVLSIPVEDIEYSNCFDFAFSINVMEHVIDVNSAILKVLSSLKVGATYRFICPNYSFPYEPHFNIPIFFSKSITEKIFYNQIFQSRRVTDQVGIWNSLNWITATSVKNIVKSLSNTSLSFNKNIFSIFLLRMLTDVQFSSRRSNWMKYIIKIITFLRLHYLLKFIPSNLSPLMDCSIQKN